MGLVYARAALFLSIPALIAPAPTTAQRDSTARLRGTVVSAYNGQPLRGVTVAVPDAQRYVVTDSTGTFELAGLPAGYERVRIAYAGRETEDYEFEVRPGKTRKISVLLDSDALDLAPVVVDLRTRDAWKTLAGFYDRRKWYRGFGRFYTRQDLDVMRPTRISAILIGNRIVTRCTFDTCSPTTWSMGRLCPVAIAVNGFPSFDDAYDRIAVDDVRAVELYRNAFLTAPGWGLLGPTDPVFAGAGSGSTWLNSPRVCGSVHIWTRR